MASLLRERPQRVIDNSTYERAAGDGTQPGERTSKPSASEGRLPNQTLLRTRRIEAVISEPRDQQGHRLNRGSAGGRPPKFDSEKYKGRNVIERSFNTPPSLHGHRVCQSCDHARRALHEEIARSRTVSTRRRFVVSNFDAAGAVVDSK